MQDRLFRDCRNAGRIPSGLPDQHRGAPGLIVLGLPHGAVPVAHEVAMGIDAPLGSSSSASRECPVTRRWRCLAWEGFSATSHREHTPLDEEDTCIR